MVAVATHGGLGPDATPRAEGVNSPFKRHPRKGFGQFSNLGQSDARIHASLRRRIFSSSTNPSEGYAFFKQPLRGLGGRILATPRAEGGGGEVNLPPHTLSNTPDRGSADFGTFWESFWHAFLMNFQYFSQKCEKRADTVIPK